MRAGTSLRSRKPAPAPPPATPRWGELCRQFPGPAAFVAREGRVIDMNEAAAPALEALERRAGGLAHFVAAAGAFARFETLEPGIPGAAALELAIVPLTEGVLLLGRPASLAPLLSDALAESRARYRDLVEISSDFAFETDAAGRFAFVSPRGALGHAARDLVGRVAAEILPELGAEAGATSPFARRERVDALHAWLPRADGEPAFVAISTLPLESIDGRFAGARGVVRDLSEGQARDAALAEAEQRARTLAHVARAVRDADGPEAALDAALLAIVRAVGAAGGGIWRGTGEDLAVAASFGAEAPADFDPAASAGETVADENDAGTGLQLVAPTTFRRRPNGALGVWRRVGEAAWSVSERRLFEALAAQVGLALAQIEGQRELERQARTDPLTGLLNRRSFEHELGRQTRHAKRTGRTAALVYVDLDNFKPVNDRHGHARGDALLRTLAERLKATARAGDLVARLGGDEFALWLADTDEAGARGKGAALLAIAAEIAAYSAAPELPLGLSIGLATFDPASGESVAAVLERADHAMYAAKRGGKGRLSVAPPPHGDS